MQGDTRPDNGHEEGVQVTNGGFSETMSKTEHTEMATTEPTTDLKQPNTPKARVRSETQTRRRFMQSVAVAGAVAATSTGGALAQETDGPEYTSGRGGLNWGSDYTQNPYYGAVQTKAKHRVEWGTDDDALRTYENDSGEPEDLGGYVDREDSENVLTVRADRIDFPSARAFPRSTMYDESGDGDKETEVSALDATHWSSTDSASGTISVAEAGDDVPALRISTDGVAAGETASATFDLTQFDAAVTSDEAKRFLQFVTSVNALASSAVVTVAVVDADGDRKEVVADSSANGGDDDVFATGTVEGAVLQQRLGDLATNANGDGTFSNIESVVVEVAEGDADVAFTAFDLERKSEWTLGSHLVNEDTDDEEREKHIEPSGEFEVTGLDTFSDEFLVDDAVFYDLQYPMRVTMGAGDLDHEYRFVEASDRPGYEYILEQRGKLELTTAIDLSWSSPALLDDVGVPSSRFLEVKTASGVEDVEFEDIDDSSYTEHTGNYDSEGETVSLADPAQTGTVVAYVSRVLLTGPNRETVESEGASGSGGAGGRGRGGSEGITGWLIAGVTAVGAFITGLFKGWW